jgi:hypothetical protein
MIASLLARVPRIICEGGKFGRRSFLYLELPGNVKWSTVKIGGKNFLFASVQVLADAGRLQGWRAVLGVTNRGEG